MGGLGIATQYPDFKVSTNNLGHVISITPEKLKEDTTLQQTMDSGEDFLEHFGTKGMKWGVRRSRAERRASREAPSEVKVKTKASLRGAEAISVKNKAGQGVTKTAGGRRNVATTDAVKTKAARQKAKASTTDALTNAELKAAVERMNLEQQYAKLEKAQPRRKRGAEFIKGLMDEYGEQALLGVLAKKK